MFLNTGGVLDVLTLIYLYHNKNVLFNLLLNGDVRNAALCHAVNGNAMLVRVNGDPLARLGAGIPSGTAFTGTEVRGVP